MYLRAVTSGNLLGCLMIGAKRFASEICEVPARFRHTYLQNFSLLLIHTADNVKAAVRVR
jgi:hypothetical protein